MQACLINSFTLINEGTSDHLSLAHRVVDPPPGPQRARTLPSFFFRRSVSARISPAPLTVALLFGAASTISSSLRIALFESSRLDIAIKMLLPPQALLKVLLLFQQSIPVFRQVLRLLVRQQSL